MLTPEIASKEIVTLLKQIRTEITPVTNSQVAGTKFCQGKKELVLLQGVVSRSTSTKLF